MQWQMAATTAATMTMEMTHAFLHWNVDKTTHDFFCMTVSEVAEKKTLCFTTATIVAFAFPISPSLPGFPSQSLQTCISAILTSSFLPSLLPSALATPSHAYPASLFTINVSPVLLHCGALAALLCVSLPSALPRSSIPSVSSFPLPLPGARRPSWQIPTGHDRQGGDWCRHSLLFPPLLPIRKRMFTALL